MSIKTRINDLYDLIIGIETLVFELEDLTDDELKEKYKDIQNPHVIIFKL